MGLRPAESQRLRVRSLMPSENHLLRALHECYAEKNGTQRFIMRCIFNREEFMRFDSTVGEFRALTPMGRPWAESWNKQKDYMERRRSEVDTVCRHNYELNQGFTVKRRGEIPEESQARQQPGRPTGWHGGGGGRQRLGGEDKGTEVGLRTVKSMSGLISLLRGEGSRTMGQS